LNPLKKLAGQTAIYGLGTMLSRLLNYLLVPFYTHQFIFDSPLLSRSDFGIITELYAYIGILMVLLTYGMETTFFRFAKQDASKAKVFSLSFQSLLFSTGLFLAILYLFLNPIAELIGYQEYRILILLLSFILALDVLTAIPFALLRLDNKALQFSGIKFVNVLVNISLNFLFLYGLRWISKEQPNSYLASFFNEDRKVIYVFIANLVASSTSMVLLFPVFKRFRFVWDWALFTRMLRYTYPLLIIGLAGMINDMGDKILLKHLIPIPAGITDKAKYVNNQLGIYGANFKLAILMTLFVQMFRYAFEPFFFTMEKEKGAKKVYADIMKYFIAFSLLIFLGVVLYLDIFKYFLGEMYWEALAIVPIILMAKFFYGVFVNLSLWYKLKELTIYGAVIGIAGAVLTLILNFVFVPKWGYIGAAWTHLSVYFAMVLISFLWGRKHFPVPYELKKIAILFVSAVAISVLFQYLDIKNISFKMLVATSLLLVYIGVFFVLEKQFVRRIWRH